MGIDPFETALACPEKGKRLKDKNMTKEDEKKKEKCLVYV